jgi:hypothetical protein
VRIIYYFSLNCTSIYLPHNEMAANFLSSANRMSKYNLQEICTWNSQPLGSNCGLPVSLLKRRCLYSKTDTRNVPLGLTLSANTSLALFCRKWLNYWCNGEANKKTRTCLCLPRVAGFEPGFGLRSSHKTVRRAEPDLHFSQNVIHRLYHSSHNANWMPVTNELEVLFTNILIGKETE